MTRCEFRQLLLEKVQRHFEVCCPSTYDPVHATEVAAHLEARGSRAYQRDTYCAAVDGASATKLSRMQVEWDAVISVALLEMQLASTQMLVRIQLQSSAAHGRSSYFAGLNTWLRRAARDFEVSAPPLEALPSERTLLQMLNHAGRGV